MTEVGGRLKIVVSMYKSYPVIVMSIQEKNASGSKRLFFLFFYVIYVSELLMSR